MARRTKDTGTEISWGRGGVHPISVMGESRTRPAEAARMVATNGVLALIAEDEAAQRDVGAALLRFHRGDWGDVDGEEAQQMDAIEAALLSPNRSTYGLLLGAYTAAGERIWITRQVTDADGGQTITVLFPSEY